MDRDRSIPTLVLSAFRIKRKSYIKERDESIFEKKIYKCKFVFFSFSNDVIKNFIKSFDRE